MEVMYEFDSPEKSYGKEILVRNQPNILFGLLRMKPYSLSS